MTEADINYTADEAVEAPTDEPASENQEVTNEAAEALTDGGAGEIDYAALVEDDLAELRREFGEGRCPAAIADLKNPVRYGALRDLGLTPKEAYLASGGRREAYDNRTHLTSTVPSGRGISKEAIPRRDIEAMKAHFPDLSDAEIQRLYRKVTK